MNGGAEHYVTESYHTSEKILVNNNCTNQIVQLDGNVTNETYDTLDESNDSNDNHSDEYETEDEAFPVIIPANLSPISEENTTQGHPIQFDVDTASNLVSPLPLCLLFNARSIWNKCNQLRELLHQVSPDICLISETFETHKKKLNTMLRNTLYKMVSSQTFLQPHNITIH